MNQLVADIKFMFNNNIDSMNMPERSLIHRSIINNPTNHAAGEVLLHSDNFKKFELNEFNYVFIVADRRFSIVLDDKIALYTSQFSYINPRGLLKATIYPFAYGETKVKYLFGSFLDGDVESGTTSPQDCDDALDFDPQIDALIYDDSSCSNPLTSSVIDDLSGLCDFDFTWDEALQKLIINDD